MSNKQATSTTTNGRNYLASISQFSKDYMSVVGIILLAIIFSIGSYLKHGEQYFLTIENWKNIMLQSATVAIVALGQAIILLTGNFDLSLGRQVAFTSAVGAILMKNVGIPSWQAILVMFALGMCRKFNGFMVAYVGIPAFIATLGTQYICYGVAKLLTQATNTQHAGRDRMAGSWLCSRGCPGKVIPICVVIMVLLYVLHNCYLENQGRTTHLCCRRIQRSCIFSGINVKRYYFGTFVLAGILATFGGLTLMSRLNSVAVTNGQNYEFDAVIGSIIGGISLAAVKAV